MVKQFDLVIQAVKDGNEVDISDMPGPPGELPSPSQPQKEEEHVQKSEAGS